MGADEGERLDLPRQVRLLSRSPAAGRPARRRARASPGAAPGPRSVRPARQRQPLPRGRHRGLSPARQPGRQALPRDLPARRSPGALPRQLRQRRLRRAVARQPATPLSPRGACPTRARLAGNRRLPYNARQPHRPGRSHARSPRLSRPLPTLAPGPAQPAAGTAAVRPAGPARHPGPALGLDTQLRRRPAGGGLASTT